MWQPNHASRLCIDMKYYLKLVMLSLSPLVVVDSSRFTQSPRVQQEQQFYARRSAAGRLLGVDGGSIGETPGNSVN